MLNAVWSIRRCQLWRRYDSALAWVLEEAVNGDLFAGVDADVVGECLEEFKEFYLTRYYNITLSLVAFEVMYSPGRVPHRHERHSQLVWLSVISKASRLWCPFSGLV